MELIKDQFIEGILGILIFGLDIQMDEITIISSP